MSIKIYVKYVKNNRDFHTTKLNLPTGALDSRSARSLMEQLSGVNREDEAAVLMVTHDAQAASFCSRILFIQDGKVFHELRKRVGEETNREFYERILSVMAQLGGGSNYVL